MAVGAGDQRAAPGAVPFTALPFTAVPFAVPFAVLAAAAPAPFSVVTAPPR